MKKYGTLFILALVVWACKNTNTPDQTVIKFLNSMYTMDFEMAKSLSTKNTWNIINGLDGKTKHITEEQKAAMMGKLKVTITSVVPETDSTSLVYYSTEPPFQIFPVIRVLSQEDQDGRMRYKIDVSSLDSLSGGDDLILTEETKPFEEDSVMTVETPE